MPGLSYEVVDVFTDTAFAGNPLAVVLDADDLPTGALQALASEFHLSETAFPMRPSATEGAAGADYRLRIFTPETELPFAGHPSIGAAEVLTRAGRVRPDGEGVVRQSCGAGLLPLRIEPDGRIELTGGTPRSGPELDPGPLLDAVGLDAADLAGPPPRWAGCGIDFAYLLVADAAVARAVPDLGRLRALGGALGTDPTRPAPAALSGVCVLAWTDGAAHARVFAGEVGVSEDPATGSAALGLGAYLAAAGLLPDGETAYLVAQGREIGRPSTLHGTVGVSAGAAIRCRVAGSVVPVARGEIVRP